MYEDARKAKVVRSIKDRKSKEPQHVSRKIVKTGEDPVIEST
jgi:hypothetical protein